MMQGDMDVIDITARLVGVFYVFGGIVTLRALAMDSILDQALASLTLSRPDPEEGLRRWILAATSVVTGVSGLSLVLLSGWAPWLFLLNLGLQAGWLIFAGKRFPPEDESEVHGRRQVANAALFWAVATAMVLWLNDHERLAILTEPWRGAALAFAALAMAVWVARQLVWNPGPRPAFGDEPGGMPVIQPRPTRVRLVRRYGYQPLLDADTGYPVDTFEHLPEMLAERLRTWENDFHDAVDPYDPDAGPAFSEDESLAHQAEGYAIVAALRAEFGDDNVEGPLLEPEAYAIARPPAEP
ncbi:MAG: hypothetical protein Q8J89_06500 [Caulobacter sp.]|nr:hypothetical protein [Caulobacter sp.]